MFNRIDHVGVAVEDMEASLELWRDQFELDVVHREIMQEQGAEMLLLAVGEGHIELIAPLAPDTPVGKFLAKRGPGLHHLAFQVSDIDATLATLRQAGLPLIDEQPRVGMRSSRVAFLQLQGTGRVLTELVEPAPALESH